MTLTNYVNLKKFFLFIALWVWKVLTMEYSEQLLSNLLCRWLAGIELENLGYENYQQSKQFSEEFPDSHWSDNLDIPHWDCTQLSVILRLIGFIFIHINPTLHWVKRYCSLHGGVIIMSVVTTSGFKLSHY